MFPKKGNSFLSRDQYAKGIAEALQAELGSTHQAVKTLMKWTDASEKTVKNWLSGTSGPRGEHLIGLIQHSDAALTSLLLMAQREPAIIASVLPALKEQLLMAVEAIDLCIAGSDG